jgi:hypothetical protein
MNEQPAPLTQAELERDMWLSWWLAHWMIGQQVREGRELPDLFRRSPSQEPVE